MQVGKVNDYWTFSNGQWTKVGGDTILNAPGVPGEKGISATTNWPSGREGSTVSVGSDGTVYLFGGLISTPESSSFEGKIYFIFHFLYYFT